MRSQTLTLTLQRCCLAAALLLPLLAWRAAAQPTWVIEELYGDTDSDDAYQVVTTSDGGALMFGPSVTPGAAPPFAVTPTLVRVDPLGALVWTQSYQIESFSPDYDVIVLGTGDIVWTCGALDAAGSGTYGVLVCKTNSTGGVIWTRMLGCQHREMYSAAITQAAGGDLIIAGGTRNVPPGPDVSDLFVCRLDAFGNLKWASMYSGTNFLDVGADVKVDANDDIYVVGSATDVAAFPNPQKALLVKLQPNGGINFFRLYGNSGADEYRSLTLDASGDIFAVGYWDRGGANSDIYVSHISSFNGLQLGPSSRYDVSGDIDGAHRIIPSLTAGNFVISGITTAWPGGLGNQNAFAMEIGPGRGAPAWINVYGSVQTDFARSIAQTPGNPNWPYNTGPGYWIAGSLIVSLAPPLSPPDMYLLRSAPTGQTGCQTALQAIEVKESPQETIIGSSTACVDVRSISLEAEARLRLSPRCAGQWLTPKQALPGSGDAAAENGTDLTLQPHPVPAGELLRLRLPDTDIRRVEIRDLSGRLLYRRDLKEGASLLSIPTAAWSAGMYSFKIITSSSVELRKLVLTK